MQKMVIDYISTMLAVYGIVYPLGFYVWNSAIVACGFPVYVIPSFWGGMGVFFVLREIRAALKG